MADHRAEPSTQAQFPGRAVLRTIVQVGIPAFLALALLVPEIVQEIVKQFGEQLPEGFRLWLLGLAALLTGVAAVITRIMALPRAIEFARKYLPFLAPDNGPEPRVGATNMKITVGGRVVGQTYDNETKLITTTTVDKVDDAMKNLPPQP